MKGRLMFVHMYIKAYMNAPVYTIAIIKVFVLYDADADSTMRYRFYQ